MFNLVREREGFTLVELIIAVSLLGIVVIAVVGIDFASRRSLIAASRRARVQDEARFTMEHMVRNIRLGNDIEPNTGTSDWVKVRMDSNPTTGYPINSPWDISDDFKVWYQYRRNTIRYRYKDLSGGGWEPPGLGIPIAKEVVNPTEPDPDRPLFTIVGGPSSPVFITIDLTVRHDASSPASPSTNPEVRLYSGANMRCKSRD